MAEQDIQTVEDIISSESSVQKDISEDIGVQSERTKDIIQRAAAGEKFNLRDLKGTAEDIFKSDKSLSEDLKELRRLRDADQLDTDLIEARKSGSDEAVLKAAQESLRLKEFGRAVGDQIEAEQLAQRTLFRESQNLARQQAVFETSAQQASASLLNRAAQTGVSKASATQGMISSINTQRGVGISDFSAQQGDIASDQTRLAASLTTDLQFLNESFDLGGDISAAAQSISDRQARDARRAQEKKDAAALGGSIGGLVGFGLGGPIGSEIGGSAGSIGGAIFG